MPNRDIDASAVHEGALKAAYVLGLNKNEAEALAQELLHYPYSHEVVSYFEGVPTEYKMAKGFGESTIAFTVSVKDVSTDGNVVVMSSYISGAYIYPFPRKEKLDYFDLNEKLKEVVGLDES